MIILGNDQGRLELEGRCELVVDHDKEGKNDSKVLGCKFYTKLKVNPKQYWKKRKIRMSYSPDVSCDSFE